MKVPKDLGLVVATKKEALWMRVKENAIAKIISLEDDLDVNKEIVILANKIIAKEKNAP